VSKVQKVVMCFGLSEVKMPSKIAGQILQIQMCFHQYVYTSSNILYSILFKLKIFITILFKLLFIVSLTANSK